MTSLHPPALLDSDTLSEIMKAHDPQVLQHAQEYLEEHRVLQFSIVTRYEVLRGLYAKGAPRQIDQFLALCRAGVVFPLTEAIVDRAAEIYGSLRRQGKPISDADLLIAATALLQDLTLVTGNEAHFRRIDGLRIVNWRRT